MADASGNCSFAIVLCGLLLGLAAVQTCEGKEWWWPWVKHHVQITNGLNGQNLQVHCKSKDDDLGVHNLAPGEAYEWGFKNNLWMTTLFWCNFDWQFGHSSFVVYSGYRYNVMYEACDNTCQWLANEYGFSIFGKRGTWEFTYHWNTANAIGN